MTIWQYQQLHYSRPFYFVCFFFPISNPLMVHLMLYVRPKQVHPHAYVYIINCGLFLSPAILISRLLLRMRRMYVASIRLDFHQECTERTLITRVRQKANSLKSITWSITWSELGQENIQVIQVFSHRRQQENYIR